MKISNLFIGILPRCHPDVAGTLALSAVRLRPAAERLSRRIAHSSTNPALLQQADYALAAG